MSNIVEINNGQSGFASVRMVMSLNGHRKPVCTLIAQDPYFFDVDPEALEDEIHAQLSLDGAAFQVPEALTIARETSDGFVTLGDFDEGLPLTDDVAALCANALTAQAGFDLKAVTKRLKASSTAATLLDQMQSHGVTFAKSFNTETVFFDEATNRILLNNHLDDATAMMLLVRACRQSALAPIKDMLRNPERAILLNRALHAEMNLIMVQVAWELSLADDKAAWKMLSRSALADLAYAFGQRATSDFRALRDGRAALAAFDQWFYSGRTRKADRTLIQTLLAAGDVAASTENAFEVIAALRTIGERGIGRNYLIDHVMTLMEDGFYGEVRDRSNANFLWFVKFERSYRAAEEAVEAEKASMPTAVEGVVISFPNVMKKHKSRARKSQEAVIVPLEAMRS